MGVAAAGGFGPTLSIVVPLLAAFIGATAVGVARYWLVRRSERAEFRAAVWVVGDDLGRLQAHFNARPTGPLGIAGHPSVKGQAWSAPDGWLPADRRVLARRLQADPGTWGKLRAVAVLAAEYRRLLLLRADNQLSREDSTRAILLDDRLTEGVATCLNDLSPYLGRAFERQQRQASKTAPDIDGGPAARDSSSVGNQGEDGFR
jgi:hypothetical protein